MKIEKLNNNSLKRRKFLYTLICAVLLLIIISLFLSHAKYRNTQSVQVATGTIDYIKDTELPVITKVESIKTTTSITLTVTATDNVGVTKYYYSKDGGSTYTDSTSNSHTFSDLSAGTYNISIYVIDASKNESTAWTSTISTVTAKDTILAANGGADTIVKKTAPNFANTSCAAKTNCSSLSGCTTSCSEATNGMYAAQDDDGTSYYFRGTVDNNWVSFANFYWRIIRINGDGTIRLIYNGTSTGATGTSVQLSSTSAYNSSYDNNAYVGYKYTTSSVHGTGTNSTIKVAVDSWYNTNLNKDGIKEYIDYNGGFCNDRYPSTSTSSSNGSGGTGTTETYYTAYIRLITNKVPSLKCQTSSDLFTASGAVKSDGTTSKGNRALTYPVGLITADEVAYAGGVNGSNNYGYWLYTGQTYWTMSPYNYTFSFAGSMVFYVFAWGSFNPDCVANSYGVRPVINLKADTVFSSGNGTSSSPYVVKTS